MTINRDKFFSSADLGLFPGVISAAQKAGTERYLAYFDSSQMDPRWSAYILATVYWETGRRMMPCREVGKGKGRAYGVPAGPYKLIYYGRGDVQITWYANAVTFSKLFPQWDFVRNPDLFLDPEVSVQVTIEGMTRGSSSRGDFTGKALEDYFSRSANDPTGARRIINGTDHAADIAAIYQHFLTALAVAREEKAFDASSLPPVIPEPEHLAAIDVAPAVLPPAAPPAPEASLPPADPPSPDPLVTKVQTLLRADGYYATGPIDGLKPAKGSTEAAILDFRNKNGLPLTPDIDPDFMDKLLMAPPVTISAERSATTAADIRAMPESVVAPIVKTNHLQKMIGLGGIIASGGWEFLNGTIDHIGAATDKLGPLKEVFAAIPGWSWIALVIVASAGIYLAGHHNEVKAVEAFRKGAVT